MSDATAEARVAELEQAVKAGPALAQIVDEWWRDQIAAGGPEEPDEGDPLCHVLNAAAAIIEDPGHVSEFLYAEHGPGDDDDAEKQLIEAGKALAALEPALPDSRSRAASREDGSVSDRPEAGSTPVGSIGDSA